MMVTFVSQCEKNALKRTRRVLDAFANRIGDNTWQTVITEEGLLAVKKLLRKTASKSTAVSCHWMRSRSRSQLLWVVGNKKQFNAEGYVPVNRTEQELPGSDMADNWRYLPLIKTFTGLAALLHDWGKATKLFQDKLNPQSKHKFKGDPLRHEWISSLLLMSLIRSGENPAQDQSWLAPLVEKKLDESHLQNALSIQKDLSRPFENLPDAASLVLWLVLSHHRLPKAQDRDKASCADRTNQTPQELLARISCHWGYENHFDDDEFQQRLPDCFVFPQGLLSESSKWCTELSHRARQLSEQLPLFSMAVNDGSWRTIAHHARLCLMLGDHYYSSKDSDKTWDSPVDLYANTGLGQDNERQLKQKLDEHLVRVAEAGVDACRLLPDFETELPLAQDIAELTPKKRLSPELKKQFGWQDKAVNALKNYRKETEDKISGYFIVNMASTGRGKTLANAKIMQALSDDQQSLRFILALGLRTLTLQTGDEYRDRIGLKEDELAVLIGSKAILELHQGDKTPHEKEELDSDEEGLGSESAESLLDTGEQIDWNENDECWQNLLPEEGLTTVLENKKDRALLYAPVLACTIDHIMGATETIRGGRYILPCLRLMSSDLVIDEIDDFVGEDLVAIGRLIHLAGMLGRKVMISSATIPPDLALAYFTAYQKGWSLFAASRNQNDQVAAGWTDEFKTSLVTINQDENAVQYYQNAHKGFVAERIVKLKQEPAKRRAEILLLPAKDEVNTVENLFFSTVQQGILSKHQQHFTVDNKTGAQASFGVVRCANIKPCIELTEYLLAADWPEDTEVRVMAYHSQQVLLLRHAQEQHLDKVLKRKHSVNDLKEGAFYQPEIRQHLDTCGTKNLIFILVATPVEEVGRDHDFDWAVVEPSSYRSIIQLAGRVRRHRRALDNDSPNMALLQYNLKGYKDPKADNVFSKPGYEQGKWQLNPSKSLNDVLDLKVITKSVDAIPRIEKDSAPPSKKLAALEHFSISRTLGCHYLTGEAKSGVSRSPKTIWGYTDDYWWMTALPQQFNRFRHSAPSLSLYRVLDEKSGPIFKIYDRRNRCWVPVERELGIASEQLKVQISKRLWLVRDYEALIVEQSEIRDEDPERTSQRLGELNLSFYQDGSRYRYNDQLGLVRV
ncbi:type I-F CRISPR-associated helicase Cas3f [Amphritea sp. 1_MG-2023]|uniref:type I-F CRISPR-associated helicase Cas3f n=1 Tax=Amphritea sp. 1_MG-2023 TaxID=3062670 RepID=UPI0026E38BDB|nr:type I-F CRISPR-associated helicase Cas3f [Amphritea sp. 1_MG-2023]MDO6563407.1 type I-F CRISPR-associated helicase Cas3f [Amphritea sp. 1_MG-2023]